VTGWARDNIDNAIINQLSRPPNLRYVILNFGVNDSLPTGSQVVEFEAKLRELIKYIHSHELKVMLLTPDPTYEYRPLEELKFEITEIIRKVAKELDLPLIDVQRYLIEFFSTNTDHVRWLDYQPDAIHLNSSGHRLKAGIIAAHLSSQVVWQHSDRQRIIPWWERSGRSPKLTRYAIQPGELGAYAHLPGSTSGYVLDHWFFITRPNTYLMYRDTINSSLDPVATQAPMTTVSNYPNLVDDNYVATNVGFKLFESANTHSPLERPVILCRMKMGLQRVRLDLGNTTWRHFGFYNLLTNIQLGFRHVSFISTVPSSVPAAKVSFYPVEETTSNLMAPRRGQIITIDFFGRLPVGTGLCFGQTGKTPPGVKGDYVGSMIYRLDNATLLLSQFLSVGGVVTRRSQLTAGDITVALPVSTSTTTLRFSLSIENVIDTLRVVLSTDSNTTDVAHPTTQRPIFFNGLIGGTFIDTNVANIKDRISVTSLMFGVSTAS
jgi:hypothetical protein